MKTIIDSKYIAITAHKKFTWEVNKGCCGCIIIELGPFMIEIITGRECRENWK